ncbi:carbohydrate sulfotransferase 11-like isoform X2 [Penaeus chinensis]|uniref:carbohydrate sulfotransferase 11-like isoform X2 n=1 Tax=Penaeus chinensis TaxID=139456 RepID=UPI001FB79E3A|nr:carbohydrate sulfotransferase 11-like isoform X2 [Penaeus chinensis]
MHERFSAMLSNLKSLNYGRVFLVLIVLVSLEICMRTFVTNGTFETINFARQEQQSQNNLNSEAWDNKFLNATSHLTLNTRGRDIPTIPITGKNISVKTSFEETKRKLDQRNQMLRGNCSLIRNLKSPVVTAIDMRRNYFIEEYDFFLCVSAKGGATTWKTHMLQMKGLPGQNVHKGYNEKRIRAGSARLADRISGKVTSVISVRHPLTRLVSAYGDKFGDGKAFAGVPRFLRMVRYFTNSWGKPVTFYQFLSYVIYQARGPSMTNNHWRPISWNCKPCTGNFDYIIKLETIDEDLAYLVTDLGIKEINVQLKYNVKNSKAKVKGYESYFKSLPPAMLKDIYNIYKYDFILFDYVVPQFMLDAVAS